jgi:hypothetical protein
MLITRLSLSVLLFTAVAAAQIVAPPVVSFTGVVKSWEFDSQGIICAPPTHTLECSEGIFGIQSNTIDLDLYIGVNVKLTAQGVSESCPLFEVLAVDAPQATLTVCGTPGLGCTMRLRSGPGGLSQHMLLVSAAPGLFSSSVAKGSLLLSPPFITLATSPAGFHPPEGYAFDFELPMDFSLVGIPIYVQAIRRDVGPVGPIRFSNAVCFAILGVPIHCIQPDC